MKFRDWKYALREEGWRRVFVWWPVEVGYHGERVWLEFAERRLDGWTGGPFGSCLWSYRLKEGSPEIGFQ